MDQDKFGKFIKEIRKKNLSLRNFAVTMLIPIFACKRIHIHTY